MQLEIFEYQVYKSGAGWPKGHETILSIFDNILSRNGICRPCLVVFAVTPALSLQATFGTLSGIDVSCTILTIVAFISAWLFWRIDLSIIGVLFVDSGDGSYLVRLDKMMQSPSVVKDGEHPLFKSCCHHGLASDVQVLLVSWTAMDLFFERKVC
jgi:hypothetical protein